MLQAGLRDASVRFGTKRTTTPKWHLWHGCPYPALQRLESLGWELATDGSPEEARLPAKLEEFIGYLENNQSFIVNYGDRYRHGEPITSSFVESAVQVGKRRVHAAFLLEQGRCLTRWRPRVPTDLSFSCGACRCR